MREIIKSIVMVVVSAIGAVGLLTVVYLLPTERMQSHVESSIEIFYKEETYPQQVAGYKTSQLDNETDAIMLLNAIYPREKMSALEGAMRVPRLGFSDDYSGRSELVSWLWLKKEPDKISEYGRYWHGYLIFLKPLLMLMDYADIRIFNMIIQLFLLSAVIVSMVERGYKKYIVPLLVTVAVMNPVAVAMSLQFSSIYYIILILLLYLCRNNENEILNKDFMIFSLVGIVTAFFDFLTYPMAAVGMTAVFMLVKCGADNDWKRNVFLVIKWFFFWGIGYVGMWSSKWLIGSLIMHENLLTEVFRQAVTHTSDVVIMDEHYNVWQVIYRNVNVLLKWPYLLMGLGLIVFAFGEHMRLDIKKWKQVLPYILVAVIPFLWIGGLKEHSGLLYWFTYRGFMASVFAILCGIQQCMYKKS